VNSDGDIRFGRWRQSIVEVLVGASTVAIAFAAFGATAELILGAVALVGIALMLERAVPQSLRPGVEPESAGSERQPAADFDAALVDATSA
jgi:hypothetical protein